MSRQQYVNFLIEAYNLIKEIPSYLAPTEDINCLELAHLIPSVPETVLAIYLGINDAVCNKGLVSPLLPRHGHNNVFVFDPQVYPGGENVPAGTADAGKILAGFEPPNNSWDKSWTYVMIQDPARSFESLWAEKGYIDMIPAKFEDFTMLTDSSKSELCIFIDAKAFEHPVNKSREYLKAARNRGERNASEFHIPDDISDEFDGLAPVMLERGEKLYVATTDFSPCAHGWSNIHKNNSGLAVVNENSAVPLDLVTAKPPVNPEYAKSLTPAKGSADMTTDWFHRGRSVSRIPLLTGLFKG
ncbi:MAG: hypothetical protein JW947_04055 [Sedimentisphaerales bacterium]|nr:hypothetical protein [Sedimentisphaerales bacterium]